MWKFYSFFFSFWSRKDKSFLYLKVWLPPTSGCVFCEGKVSFSFFPAFENEVSFACDKIAHTVFSLALTTTVITTTLTAGLDNNICCKIGTGSVAAFSNDNYKSKWRKKKIAVGKVRKTFHMWVPRNHFSSHTVCCCCCLLFKRATPFIGVAKYILSSIAGSNLSCLLYDAGEYPSLSCCLDTELPVEEWYCPYMSELAFLVLNATLLTSFT